jgi:hypothetical protein
MDAPISFRPDLDLDLFALDRIDALLRRAPEGMAKVQQADPGRERPRGWTPTPTELRGTVAEDVARRPLHVSLRDVDEWAPEYAEQRDRVFDAAGVERTSPRYAQQVVIRVFSPDVPVALHGDGETQLDVGVGGRNAWHVYPPSSLSQVEHEGLLRGGQFVPWRDMPLFRTFDLHPGDGFGSPPRWPHWIEHPGPDPAVSFEVGFFTPEQIRERKVYDMNYVLRKLRLRPVPPGEVRSRDRLKQRAFDVVSLVTRKGGELRGV